MRDGKKLNKGRLERGSDLGLLWNRVLQARS